MKKFAGLLVILLLIIGSVLFFYQSKIDEQINLKINDLNGNGFLVKHNQSTNYIKTTVNGEVEVINPDKAISYMLSNVENQDLKKSMQIQYESLSLADKEILFEGVKFDYDFIFENFNGKLDSNIYLANLSKKAMYNLSSDSNDESSKWLLDFLKNKKLQVSINEKKEYKIADIDTVIPNEVFITIKNFTGNEHNFAISEFRISDARPDIKDSLIINNINVDYEITPNKQTSKAKIGIIEYQGEFEFFKINNLVTMSDYERMFKHANSQNEISFDDVVVKVYNQETMNLKNSSLKLNIESLPALNMEEFTKYLQAEDFNEYLSALTQNGTTLSCTGNASSYVINSQKMFDTLKFDLAFSINKNGSILEAKNINDILDGGKLTLDLDSNAASNVKSLLSLKDGYNVDFVDSADNLKRFEAILKNDGIYINDKKIVDENELLLPNKEEEKVFDDTPIQKVEQKNLTYSYKMVGENLLKLDIKYSTNLDGVSSGGIYVSFPQLSDKSKVTKYSSNSFKNVDFYNAQAEVWDENSKENILSSYLIVEAFDTEWKNKDENKDISLFIDVRDIQILEVYLRAEALNESNPTQVKSEIIPKSGETDLQNNPAFYIEIPIIKN